MKLHLPCALRGALLACFALACTAPAWAATDLLIDGTQDSYLIKTGGEYTLKPGSNDVAASIDIERVSLKDSTTLNIGDTSTKFTSIRIDNLLVHDSKNLVINIASGTTVYLDNVNFNGTIQYNLGTGATLVISASDCTKSSLNGTGNVLLTGGAVDATSIHLPRELEKKCQDRPGDVPTYTSVDFQQESLDTLLGVLTASGSNITFRIAANASIDFNVRTGSCSIANSTANYKFSWHGAYTKHTITADEPSAVVDPDVDIYRDMNKTTGTFWNLHTDVSVDTLLADKSVADITTASWATLAPEDDLLFAGGALTTEKEGHTYVIGTNGGEILVAPAITDENGTPIKQYQVILAPASNSTLDIANGDGAVNAQTNPLGLLLKGGRGSTVILRNVTTEAPEKITFETRNTTLMIAGPPSLTMDASKNTFLADTHLGKLGGGNFTYIATGATDGSDAIGSLSNADGKLTIQNAKALTVGKLTAGTLTFEANSKISTSAIQAGTLTVSDDSTLEVEQTIKADTISISGKESHVTAGSISAGTLDVAGEGATMSVTSAAVSGLSTIRGSVSAENISITGYNGAQAALTAMTLTGNSLTTATTANSTITTTAPVTLSLGTLDNSCVNAAAGATLADTTLVKTKGSASVMAADSLTLRNTTHNAGTFTQVTGSNAIATMAGSVIQQGDVRAVSDGLTLMPEANINVGGTHYTATTNSNYVTLVGSATADMMTVNAMYVDLTGAGRDEPTAEGAPAPVLMTATNGASFSQGSGYFLDYITEPGMVPYLSYETPGQLTYVLKDESDKIIAALNTHENAQAVTGIISDYGMEGGTVQGKGELGELFNFLRDSSRATQARRQAALDAIVSGSHTMMADSQRRNVLNTVDSLRNRIIQMGSVYDTEPDTYIHAWIAAEGSNDEVDQDGAYAGYEYQTWGGSVGVHADVGNFSFGAAVSAAYGDLSSSAADHAEGDHDAVSISAFVRHQTGRWTQMGILSLGRNEIEMQRTIRADKNPGKGESKSYTGDGDASGHTITAYYEGGYTISLNDENSQVIQPIVSIMLTSARMGKYHETGTIGNAGVYTPTEDYVYGTVGIGARYQIVLGTTSVDRISFAEVRAKIVQDFGDETNETSAYFSGVEGQRFTLRGADVGRTGFQLGAGISVPTNVYTTLFADVDADFRSGATSVSGSVGVRLEF